MKKRGFTLIDLLIVVWFLMILTSIIAAGIPVEQFKKTSKQNNKMKKDNYSAYRGRR